MLSPDTYDPKLQNGVGFFFSYEFKKKSLGTYFRKVVTFLLLLTSRQMSNSKMKIEMQVYKSIDPIVSLLLYNRDIVPEIIGYKNL